jgi:hypothetical protein
LSEAQRLGANPANIETTKGDTMVLDFIWKRLFSLDGARKNEVALIFV